VQPYHVIGSRMNNLEDVRKAIATVPKRCVFVSRSGAEKQRGLAIWIASRLKAHGYIPILENADFMLAMEAALASGARVLALMSREYLASRHCLKEATAALDDQRSRRRRLVPLSIDDCQPRGLLRYVDQIDVAAVWRAGDATEMDRVLLAALRAPANLDAEYLVPSAMDASQVVHPKVLMHDEETFAGREEDLKRLRDLLWSGGTAAWTLAGTAGVGKTTLARAYAFLQRREYCAVWWLRAESTETLIEDLVDLDKRYFSGFVPMARGFVYLADRARVVLAPCSVVARVDHDGSVVLRRGARGSAGASRQAGGLQHGSGLAVHVPSLHGRAGQARDPYQHGRQGRVAGRCVRRAPLADHQIRGGLSPRLRQRVGRAPIDREISRPLQSTSPAFEP
jgi:hypothetical protein